MTVRPVLHWPDKRLRTPAADVAEITDDVRAIWDDMIDVMEAMPGVGLAAVQIGVMQRLAVVDASDTRGKAVRMANPEVLHASVQPREHEEASPCLPGVSAKITRPRAVTVRFLNEAGEIDPEKLAALRARMCSAEGAQASGEGSGRGSGGRRRGGGMFGGNPEDTRARYFLSLNHNITLENEVLLSQNGPLFDQLDGDVLSGGAIPQHTARLEGGIFKQGYGMRLSGNYIGEARLNGSGLPGSSDLFYGDLATFDIRVFADLGQVLKKEEGWLDSFRVSFRVDNVFDARRRVEDENGVVPDAFQPFRIDPTGRYIGVDLRKAF